MPHRSRVLVEVFLQQIEGVEPEDLDTAWLGLKLNAEHKAELQQRILELLEEFKGREPDADGEPYSLFTALHPDLNPPAAGPSGR